MPYDVLRTITIAMVISALSLATYDRFVRKPLTPRIGVVDVTLLYDAVQVAASRDLIDQTGSGGGATQHAAIDAVRRSVSSFGPAIEHVLKDLSNECQCAIVAMAAVVGDDTSVPNYTAEASKRLEAELQLQMRKPR
jgi:hypothetical protein